jgi:hypothetical protein
MNIVILLLPLCSLIFNLYWQFLFGIRRGSSSHHYSITGTVIVYIVVVYNVELDKKFIQRCVPAGQYKRNMIKENG